MVFKVLVFLKGGFFFVKKNVFWILFLSHKFCAQTIRLLLPARRAKPEPAGIDFTQGPIVGFFAKFQLDRLRGVGLRPSINYENFEFYQ